MNFVALRMSMGDRAKYAGRIFATAFSTFPLENQHSIFASLIKRTTSQILDVTDADIWVMDKKAQYINEVKLLAENNLYQVRGVEGVDCAVRFFEGRPHPKGPDGNFRVVNMMGLDDASPGARDFKLHSHHRNYCSFGQGVHLPICTAGRFRSDTRVQDYRLEQPKPQFESIVLKPFQEIEHALSGFACLNQRHLGDFLSVLDARAALYTALGGGGEK